MQKRVQEERNLATALTALLPQQSGTREEKFGGEDFGPSFRREWTETDTGRYPPEFELWEIRRCTPNAIQPDIKNMRTVVEVWEFLEQEYGQLLELTSELVDSLTNFQFSKEAKTEEAKFTELYRSWTTVYGDLEEVGKVSVLDHEPTLARVAKRLPSHVSRTKYVDMRMEELPKEKSELEIITNFLTQERKRQKALGRLEEQQLPAKTEDRQPPDKGGRGCFGCGKEGHRVYQCPDKASSAKGGGNNQLAARAHASMKLVPTACQACSGQHSFQGRCSTGLASAPAQPSATSELQTGLTLSNRQEDISCALTGQEITNETGAQLRLILGNCTILVNGAPCGVKHNSLLHGSTSKYCNLVQVNSTSLGVAPTLDDVEGVEAGPRALMQIQWLEVQGDVHLALVFWDAGSNVNLVRQEFARMAGWTGRPVVQPLQTTGRGAEEWRTTAYCWWTGRETVTLCSSLR